MMELNRETRRRLELVKVQGQLVEKDALRIAERINEYDPNLYVQVLTQPETAADPPFRVMERCRDGVDRIAMTAWTLDNQLLERVRAADTARLITPSDFLGSLDKKNEKIRQEDRRRYQEKKDVLSELVSDVLKTPKDTYTANHPISGKKLTFKA